MPGPATDAIARFRRRLAQLDEERAWVMRAMAALEEQAREEQGLTVPDISDTTDSMHQQQRGKVAASKHGAVPSPQTRALRLAANRAGHSLRSLAVEVGIPQPSLTMAAQGLRPISRAVAEHVARITGLAATVGNWPKLRDD